VRRIANQHDTPLNAVVDDDLLDRRKMDRVDACELAEDAWHRSGEVFKKLQKPDQSSIGGVLCCEGREIRIAVKTIRPDRHRKERLSPAEHRSPGLYRAGVADEKTPAHLAELPRTYAAKSELSDRRMDPVGSHDEVVLARRTVSEVDVDLVIRLAQHCHGAAKPHRGPCGALEEDAMKLTTFDAHAGADRVPER
jgi:hypothetical protein